MKKQKIAEQAGEIAEAIDSPVETTEEQAPTIAEYKPSRGAAIRAARKAAEEAGE